MTGSNLPVRFAGRSGLTFTLLKGSDVIENVHFIEIVAMLIERGVAVFLSVPGALGYESGHAFLNDGMAASVHSHERVRLVADLKTAYAAAIAQPRNKIVLGPEG